MFDANRGSKPGRACLPHRAKDRIARVVRIVDDHALLRTGVRLLIDAQPDMEVVGEANSVMQALEVALQKVPDVICLDLSLPGESGLSEAIREGND